VLVAQRSGEVGELDELESAGFEVVITTEPAPALAALKERRVALALVDAHFGDDGLSFCHQLWASNPGFPVLVIGPRDEDFVARALAAGADDYLVVPLRSAELVARVRAVLRRVPSPVLPAVTGAIVVGEVRLDPESHEVTLGGSPVHLPLREFQLLQLLMENVGIVISRTTLLSRLWGASAPLDGTSLEVHVRRLRAKIEDDPAHPRRIVTVRGVGYRYQRH
jgi:two-component system response regulator RegX3